MEASREIPEEKSRRMCSYDIHRATNGGGRHGRSLCSSTTNRDIEERSGNCPITSPPVLRKIQCLRIRRCETLFALPNHDNRFSHLSQRTNVDQSFSFCRTVSVMFAESPFLSL